MAPVTPLLSAATPFTLPMQSFGGYKTKRSQEDRDLRTLSSRKCRKLVTNSILPDRQLTSERRIKIVAAQISCYFNDSLTLGYSSENLLALFYISAYSSRYPNIKMDNLRDYSEQLLENLDISQRSIVYKVLPLLDGEFGRKMRSVAAPILYHIPKNFDCHAHFKYSVKEILSEGFELSQNLLNCSKEDFDFLCAKLDVESLKGHTSKEKKRCIKMWDRSLSARLALLDNDYEVLLSKYETVEIYDKDPQPPTYKSTQLFNVHAASRPDQIKEARNPAWFFSTVIEGLNVVHKSDAQGYFTEELRIDQSLIKMTDCTEGEDQRPTFSLLSTLHQTLEGIASNAIETIAKTCGFPEAFQLPYTACKLEFDFLKGRIPNVRPIHWKNVEEPLLSPVIPSWSFLSEFLDQDRQSQQGVTFDIPADDQEGSFDQAETSSASDSDKDTFRHDFLRNFSSTADSKYGFDTPSVNETSFADPEGLPSLSTPPTDGDKSTSSSHCDAYFYTQL